METKDKKDENLITLYDSLQDYEECDVRDMCEANEWPVPKEGTTEWYDITRIMNDNDWEAFEDEMKSCKLAEEGVVITGTHGLWWGRPEIKPVWKDNLFEAIMKCFGSCDYLKVALNKKEGVLEVNAIHHDGTNHYQIHALNKKGRAHLKVGNIYGYGPEDNDTVEIKPYMLRKIKMCELWGQ